MPLNKKLPHFLLSYFSWLLPLALLTFSLIKVFQATYPAPTSWLPADIGIAKFIRQWGWSQDWYPYWYLGLPFRWATGPLVPGLLLISSQVLRFHTGLILQVSLLTFGTLGSYFLGKKLFGNWLSGLLTALLYSFLPGLVWVFPQLWQLPWGSLVSWRIMGSLTTGSLSTTLAGSLLPWSLLTAISVLEPGSKPHGIATFPRKPLQVFTLTLTTLFLILADPSILPSFFVFLGLYLVVTRQPSPAWHLVIWGLSLGFIASFFWYSPRFWLHLLSSPSLGGQPLWQVALFLIKYLGALSVIGFGFTKWKKLASAPSNLKWPAAALALFFTLTLVRFLKDPDFWLDYTAWARELELATALLIGGLISRSSRRALLILIVLAISLLQCWRIYILSDNWISNQPNTAENQILQWSQEHLEVNQRVFVSGTPVPWLSSLDNVNQLRGARDAAALHSLWADAAYQIRVGDSGTVSRYWLQALGISHLVVHQQTSSEFWHDFDYPEKFADLAGFQLLEDSSGDSWYQLTQGSLARATSLELLNLKPPQSGDHFTHLEQYVDLLGDSLITSWTNPGQLIIQDTSVASAVSLAITSDRGWQATTPTGESLKTQTDPLGNLLILNPQKANQIILSRKNPVPSFAWHWPLLALLGCLLTQPALDFFTKKLPPLSLGFHQDDEEY